MEREHYIVDGLVNENMKTQVKNALEKIDGVSNVCVDLGRGSVEVMYNEPATQEEIKNCIENTGHNIQ
jgi:copper chaperone CopZ